MTAPKNQAWLDQAAELRLPLLGRVLLRQGREGKVFGGIILADQIDFGGRDNDDQVWEVELTLRRKLKVLGHTYDGKRPDDVMVLGGLCINRSEFTGDEDEPPVEGPPPAAASKVHPSPEPSGFVTFDKQRDIVAQVTLLPQRHLPRAMRLSKLRQNKP